MTWSAGGGTRRLIKAARALPASRPVPGGCLPFSLGGESGSSFEPGVVIALATRCVAAVQALVAALVLRLHLLEGAGCTHSRIAEVADAAPSWRDSSDPD